MNKLAPIFIAGALAIRGDLTITQSQINTGNATQGHNMRDHAARDVDIGIAGEFDYHVLAHAIIGDDGLSAVGIKWPASDGTRTSSRSMIKITTNLSL